MMNSYTAYSVHMKKRKVLSKVISEAVTQVGNFKQMADMSG